MKNQHPLTPPPELVQQWMTEYTETKPNCLGTEFIATRAAAWGADQELEACCNAVSQAYLEPWQLRAARRPKPPSLKEQALKVLEDANLDAAHHNLIRRALKQLDD